MQLAWTPKRLLSFTAIESILADPKKTMVRVKITMMNANDKYRVVKKGIWFEGRCHLAYSFTEISPDIRCSVYCY